MNATETTLPEAAPLEKPYRLNLARPDEAEPVAEYIEEGFKPEVLSEAEYAAARKLTVPKRLREWVAARLAAKRLLSWRLQQAGLYLKPGEISIENRPDGMPFARLPDGAVLGDGTLSLSHSSGWGAAAVCEPWALVGIDLEAVAPRPKSFLETMAHDSEWAPWMEADFAEQTRLWTLKEAVSKLLGTGMSVGFWDIRFPLSGEARTLELHGNALACWEKLGRPAVHFDSTTEEPSETTPSHRVLTVAYAARSER